MREITLEELLEAGCHFGHQVERQNPKARDFVYEAREGIHIIDLAKTKEGLEKAGEFAKSIAKNGGTLLVVATKRQAKGVVEDVLASRKPEKIAYATYRWVGGTLTNFSEIAKNIKKLKDLEEKLGSKEETSKYTKKEVGQWAKEKQKLEHLYGGIKDLEKIPSALFIIDSHHETIAVKEALKMHIPTIAMVDTNADPGVIDYPIPANDDAVGSIQIIAGYIIDAWMEGIKTATTEGTEKAATTEGTEKDSGKTVVARKKSAVKSKSGSKQ